MAITNKQRIDRMEDFLREHEYADLQTLAKEFDASLSTVRRTLNELETRGLVRRHHGGASWIAGTEEKAGYDFITQDDRQTAEKHAMAELIASRITPGMTVMLDGGTSTYAVARLLASRRIIVITNSLPIAALYNEVSNIETILTGGTVYNRLGVLYGPTCEASLAEMHADVCILGGAGITEEGIWNSNAFIIATQKRMIKAADKTIYALDHTKLGRRALTLATPFFPNMCVVTSGEADAKIQRAIRTANATLELSQVRPVGD